jgi:hypothetical protein
MVKSNKIAAKTQTLFAGILSSKTPLVVALKPAKPNMLGIRRSNVTLFLAVRGADISFCRIAVIPGEDGC